MILSSFISTRNHLNYFFAYFEPLDNLCQGLSRTLMKQPFSKPLRPSDHPTKPPKPSDRRSKSDKGPLFKDRRTHRIELRKKITDLKEQINELKSIETTDEAKKKEIQETISELRITLKECDMEKEAIENFNHTQFIKNKKVSDENTDRYQDEKKGNTRFFDHLKNSSD